MPYYLYKVHSPARFEKLAEHAAFPEASAEAKRLRAEAGPDAGFRVRVIFAEDPAAAEALLSQAREPAPRFDDD